MSNTGAENGRKAPEEDTGAGVQQLSAEELELKHQQLSSALADIHTKNMANNKKLLETGLNKFKDFAGMIYHIMNNSSVELTLLRIIEVHLRSGTLTQEIYTDIIKGLDAHRESMKNPHNKEAADAS